MIEQDSKMTEIFSSLSETRKTAEEKYKLQEAKEFPSIAVLWMVPLFAMAVSMVYLPTVLPKSMLLTGGPRAEFGETPIFSSAVFFFFFFLILYWRHKNGADFFELQKLEIEMSHCDQTFHQLLYLELKAQNANRDSELAKLQAEKNILEQRLREAQN